MAQDFVDAASSQRGLLVAYDQLPKPIRALAAKNFQLLKKSPRHPSIRFKKIGPYWSARVGRDDRALAVATDDGFVWFWIGSHADYERLLDDA